MLLKMPSTVGEMNPSMLGCSTPLIVTFASVTLLVDTFVKRQCSGFRSTSPRESPKRDSSIAIIAASWTAGRMTEVRIVTFSTISSGASDPNLTPPCLGRVMLKPTSTSIPMWSSARELDTV